MRPRALLTLLGLLDSKMPEDFVKQAWTNEGLQLSISRTSTAHTVLIPTLISGLIRIALSGNSTDLFLEKITQGLLFHWKQVVDCEVMYSISSTPLTCCSTGEAMVWETTDALAPG